MTTRERMFLTPWEKFRKHGVVPWKLILHVLLVAVVTAQVRHVRRATPTASSGSRLTPAACPFPVCAARITTSRHNSHTPPTTPSYR